MLHRPCSLLSNNPTQVDYFRYDNSSKYSATLRAVTMKIFHSFSTRNRLKIRTIHSRSASRAESKFYCTQNAPFCRNNVQEEKWRVLRTCYQIDFTVGISNAASNLSIHENFKRDFAVLISLTARIISSLYSRTSVSNYAIRERAAKIPIQLADEKERKPRALAGYPNEHLAAGRFLATCQR